jgi:hypothetical protein
VLPPLCGLFAQLSPKLSTKAEDWVMRHPLHAGEQDSRWEAGPQVHCAVKCSRAPPLMLKASGIKLSSLM